MSQVKTGLTNQDIKESNRNCRHVQNCAWLFGPSDRPCSQNSKPLVLPESGFIESILSHTHWGLGQQECNKSATTYHKHIKYNFQRKIN